MIFEFIFFLIKASRFFALFSQLRNQYFQNQDIKSF